MEGEEEREETGLCVSGFALLLACCRLDGFLNVAEGVHAGGRKEGGREGVG